MNKRHGLLVVALVLFVTSGLFAVLERQRRRHARAAHQRSQQVAQAAQAAEAALHSNIAAYERLTAEERQMVEDLARLHRRVDRPDSKETDPLTPQDIHQAMVMRALAANRLDAAYHKAE